MLGSNGSYFSEILTQAGVVTEEQAKAAEEAAEQRRIPITTAVKELGFADRNRISQALAEHFGLRSVDLATTRRSSSWSA
jgi:methylphosphotriester-DNA--protein-cysteine methyltransferase